MRSQRSQTLPRLCRRTLLRTDCTTNGSTGPAVWPLEGVGCTARLTARLTARCLREAVQAVVRTQIFGADAYTIQMASTDAEDSVSCSWQPPEEGRRIDGKHTAGISGLKLRQHSCSQSPPAVRGILDGGLVCAEI